MGNICDCLSNDSDGEGLVPPVTRDSRYGGLRDPVPATLPAEVVTSTSSSATEFAALPSGRPVAEVHPQTHVSKSPPLAAAAIPSSTAAVAELSSASIEKVTLPPPPVKSPVKKTPKEAPAAVPRPKADSLIADDPLDVPRFQVRGGGTVTNEPVYSTIQPKLASPKSSAPPAAPSKSEEPLPPQAFFHSNVEAAAPPEEESFTEFVKDRTRSGGSSSGGGASLDAGAVLTPTHPAPVDAQPVASAAPIFPAAAPMAPTPVVVPSPVASSPLSASPPATIEATSAGGGGGNFTEFLDKVVAETKKNIAETVVTPKPFVEEENVSPSTEQPVTASPTTEPSATASPSTEPSATASPLTEPSITASPSMELSATISPSMEPSATASPATDQLATAALADEMSIVDLDSSSPSPMEKSSSPDDFERQKAASNADVEKLPVQNSYQQMTEILTIPGAKEKDEKESSPFEIGSSESELSKPDVIPSGKSLAEELEEFGPVVDSNANIDVAKTEVIVGHSADGVDGVAAVILAKTEPIIEAQLPEEPPLEKTDELADAATDSTEDASFDAVVVEEEITMAAESEVLLEAAPQISTSPVKRGQAQAAPEADESASDDDDDEEGKAEAALSASGDNAKILGSAVKPVVASPAVIDAMMELELTNEDSPRLTAGETLTGDVNVNEVFSHDQVRISHSSTELAVAPAVTEEPEEPKPEPLLDLQKELEASFKEDDDEADDPFQSSLKEDEIGDVSAGDSDLVTELIHTSTEQVVAAENVDVSFGEESNASLDEESSSMEKSVDLLASDLLGDVLRASTEELAAAAIVADVELEATQKVAAAADVDAVEELDDSTPTTDPSNLESSIEVLHSTPEKSNRNTSGGDLSVPLGAEMAVSPFGGIDADFPPVHSGANDDQALSGSGLSAQQNEASFDEMESWLSSGAVADDSEFVSGAPATADDSDFIVLPAKDATPFDDVKIDAVAGVEGAATSTANVDDGVTHNGVVQPTKTVDEDEDFDDDGVDDEYAKIMATARKMDAKAKERGDSDAAAVGINLGGGDDDFLQRLAKKISRESESEEAPTAEAAAAIVAADSPKSPAPATSLDDARSEMSPLAVSDKSLDSTNEASFFSATSDVSQVASELTLVEEQSSLLDFDDAFNKGISGVLDSLGATPVSAGQEDDPFATPVSAAKEDDPFATLVSAVKENDPFAPIPVPEGKQSDATSNGFAKEEDPVDDAKTKFETTLDGREEGASGGGGDVEASETNEKPRKKTATAAINNNNNANNVKRKKRKAPTHNQ